uniref:hypothetical protein n=1 Tax=Lentilactobacillus hilgardii TaxID=1588 RepID=UPI00403F8709
MDASLDFDGSLSGSGIVIKPVKPEYYQTPGLYEAAQSVIHQFNDVQFKSKRHTRLIKGSRKYFKIFSDLTSVFSGQKLKVNRLTSAYDDQTLAIERNTKAKEANVDAGNETSTVDDIAGNAGGEGKVAEDAEKDGKTAVHDIDDTNKVTEDTGKIGRFAKLAEKFKGVSKFVYLNHQTCE